MEDRPSMDRMNTGERAFAGAPAAETEAIDFVRFCHRRRRVGWPELYDEMCAVAGRGLYRGYGADELSSIGIGLGLFQMPALAGLVAQVVAEDLERRRRTAAALQASQVLRDTVALTAVGDGEPEPSAIASGADGSSHRNRPASVGAESPDVGAIRIAVAAGA
jgi:hypothetical protein